jgi:hypothetical protein
MATADPPSSAGTRLRGWLAFALAALLAGAGALAGKPGRVRWSAVLAAAALTIAANVVELRELAALARSDLESIVHEQRVLAQWLEHSGARRILYLRPLRL